MNVLETIVAHKRTEVQSRRREMPASALRETPHFGRPTVSLRQAVLAHPPIGIIAEIKRASPSAGAISRVISPAAVAADYEAHGAAACSVLTDTRFFGGTLDDLTAARSATSLPILRKEFIIDEYQIPEAKAFGADAILLIAGILSAAQLAEYHLAASELGMEALVELYEPSEIDTLNPDLHLLVGINNRDLRTFQVDLRRSGQIAALLPDTVTAISESGIRTAKDLQFLAGQRIRGALIGEHLMRSGSPGAALRRLLDSL